MDKRVADVRAWLTEAAGSGVAFLRWRLPVLVTVVVQADGRCHVVYGAGDAEDHAHYEDVEIGTAAVMIVAWGLYDEPRRYVQAIGPPRDRAPAQEESQGG